MTHLDTLAFDSADGKAPVVLGALGQLWDVVGIRTGTVFPALLEDARDLIFEFSELRDEQLIVDRLGDKFKIHVRLQLLTAQRSAELDASQFVRHVLKLVDREGDAWIVTQDSMVTQRTQQVLLLNLAILARSEVVKDDVG